MNMKKSEEGNRTQNPGGTEKNATDSENVRDLYTEIYSAPSHDAYQAISIKAEVLSDEEEEEYPVPVTDPGIKAEPKNPTDSEKLQGPHSEMSPAYSQDSYHAISVKAEVLSDAEEEEYPVLPTFVGIKVEPEILYYLQPMHGEEQLYSCEVYNKPFSDQDNLKRHQCIHKWRIHCDVCNKSFSNQTSMKRHQITHSGERPFCCDMCNKSFPYRASLKMHKRIHSGERPFCCDVCNKSFSRLCILKTHRRIHSGERPFCCNVCNKSFSDQANQKRHQRVHSGERPFSCDMCNKSFGYRFHLKTHLLTHSDMRSKS